MLVVEYSGTKCEYCESYKCNRAQYRKDLADFLVEVAVSDKRPNQKRFDLYHRFTWIKHMHLGRCVRCQIFECVQELILVKFHVEKGERKRGYEEV